MNFLALLIFAMPLHVKILVPQTQDTESFVSYIGESISEIKKETKLRLRISTIKIVSDPLPNRDLNFFARAIEVRYWYYRIFKRQKQKSLNLVITPGLATDYTAGEAFSICSDSVAVVNLPKYPDGLKNTLWGITATKHELGHLIGAQHDETTITNIMHPAVLGYTTDRVFDFSEISKKQIRRCLRK